MKLAVLASLVLACAPIAHATTVLSNAQIHTLNAQQPTAAAMAWDDAGRILALGETQALLLRYPEAQRIDAANAVVVPGLIDAHAHLLGLAMALTGVDLVGADSKDDVLRRAQQFAADLPPGDWLRGRGWDQNRWPEQAFPSAADLDAAFPDRPVWLERVDGHAGWANSAALRALAQNLDGDWQPEGGRIERIDGKASGVFVDGAMALIDAVAPPPSDALRTRALQSALAVAARNGLTGVHDMGVSLADLALYRRFADAGKLTLRVTAYADGDNAALAALCAMGRYRHASGRLDMAGVKLYADGALGSRGAALLADYDDQPHNRGLLLTAPAALRAAMVKARDCGLQVATHAIGDRGNRIVLDAYQAVLADAAGGDHRWRVEHAQIVAPGDIARFKTLKLIASMQPTHATSDMPWAGARVGKARLFGAYAWRRFLDAGVPLALGSDFPVEPVDPRLGLYAAVSRQDIDGQPAGGWLPEQRLRADEALRGFTRDAAWAGFAENSVGTLKPGYRADFVVLDGDPLRVAARALLDLTVLSTWVDGEPVYQMPSHFVRPAAK
ncbi:MAG: amidohydrolase [Lysobacterales bacterium CG17_big_fil_post_rev_8_21_14_2_50_64_11]|nr:MAG: amidohydrolase [Xanthomonadales bacterium CG17_big_fil_post_rev_8_21_14_2_50_64_11]PIX60954.1 MAG: amidohydrolase [Xanthomonadales bacterium CG_4_10_14_3_um_filter_64_11]